MRELEQSPVFGVPALTVIENEIINRVRASNFQLAVTRAKPKGQDSETEPDQEVN